MNKKILLSVAAAATLAMTFTGCGSSDSSSASANTSENGVITVDGVDYGISASKVSGATIAISATGKTTLSGGTDQLGKSHSSSVGHKAIGNNTNAFTNLAVGGSLDGDLNSTIVANFTALGSAFGLNVAEMDGIYDVDSQADAKMEIISMMIENMLSDNANGEKLSLGVMLGVVKQVTDGNITDAFNRLNTEIGGNLLLADIAAMATAAKSGTANARGFSTTVKALKAFRDTNATGTFDFAYELSTNTPLYTGITLENNTTVGDNNSTISNMDLNGSSIIGGTYENNETGTMLISLTNLDDEGINDNASYAVKLTNLIPTVTGTTINGFTYHNTNTTLTVTANSNMDKAITLNDQNVTKFFDTCGVIDGMDINVTAFTSYISTLVHAEAVSETNTTNIGNGNFTSGMDSNLSDDSTFGLKVLVDINDNNITTSDKKWLISTDTINIGADSETATAGTVNSGYKVIDSNITK